MKLYSHNPNKSFVNSLTVLVTVFFVASCASYEYPKGYGFVRKERLIGHEKDVLDMDLSEDGRYLVSSGVDDTVRVWDTEEMQELGRKENLADDIYSVDFGPNASRVVTGCRDGAVRIYELPSGEIVHEMRGHAEAVYSVAYSPKGDYVVSGGKDSTVRVWDVKTGKLLRVFRGHSEELNTVIIDEDGEMAYSAGRDGTVRSWFLGDDLAPGFIHKLAKLSVINVAVSPDENRIACTGIHHEYDKSAKMWRETNPLFIAELTDKGLANVELRYGHDKHAWGLAWSPDGKTIVTGGNDERLLFRDIESYRNREKVLPGGGNIWDIEYSPDGNRIYVATSKKGIIVYSK